MKFALGTAQFGLNYGIANENGKIGRQEVAKILSFAKTNGINTLDTAIAYGDSEESLGENNLTNWQLVTKLPSVADNCLDIEYWIHSQLMSSLARLHVDSVEAVLLHRPDQLLGREGEKLSQAMVKMKSLGLTKKIGVSVYSPTELSNILMAMPVDIVQLPFNILDRRLLDSGWLSTLKNNNVEVHTRSTFLQGLLLTPFNKRPAKFLKWNDIWLEWDRWLAQSGLTPLQACLRYVLSVKEIDKVLIGVDGLVHLEQVLGASKGDLLNTPTWPSVLDEKLINPAMWNQL